jgi:hypothetical protein
MHPQNTQSMTSYPSVNSPKASENPTEKSTKENLLLKTKLDIDTRGITIIGHKKIIFYFFFHV